MKTLLLLITSIFLLMAIPLSQQLNLQDDAFWVKLKPAFNGAEFVMDKEACIACHEEVTATYEHTIHSRIFQNNPGNKLETADCESCHGPRSLHIEDPDNRFAFTEEQYTVVCQQCHQGGDRMYWHNSLHQASGVGCVSCHTVMEQRSSTALLSKSSEWAVCSSCHTDVTAKLMRTSRHPVREGKLDCSSCHNVHGTPWPGMLVKASTTETCNSCHQEKRGPFLWEHPPVREDCMTCHEPHGSNNRSLLITQNASLCVSCHQYGGHINQYRYNRVSTPYGNGCVNCHMSVHGSNHPSGAKLTR
jgi:DmsE family decaheme c-type cytochrome